MKKIALFSLMVALGLGVYTGANVLAANAHFGGIFGGPQASQQEIASQQQIMFQQQADLLGIGIDEVKDAWAQGKSMQELAEEHGITAEELRQKIRTQREGAIKVHLQALVEQGVITQTQADQRLTAMQSAKIRGGIGIGIGVGQMRHHHGF